MPTEIYLLKVGMTMTEGVVAEWYVPDGGSVTEGEPLYCLETEKVSMDVEAPSSGTLKRLVDAGITIAPATVIGLLYAPGELVEESTSVPEARSAPGHLAEPAQPPAVVATEAARPNERVPSSPEARRLAAELGLALSEVRGTGPGRRIVEADVRAAHAAARSPIPPSATSTTVPTSLSTAPDALVDERFAGQRIALRGMRRVIAEHMYESLRTTAQLTMNMEVAMDEAVRLRGHLVEEWAADGIRPSYTDLVTKAVAIGLREHPRMNALLDGDDIVLLDEVHVGMAVGLDDGLVVAVIRNADRLSLKQVATESSRLARAAREGNLVLDEMGGGSFTVTSLGTFGVDSFTPILNTPQVGILGVNRLHDGVGWEDGLPVRRQLMTLSLTWDHRAIDGIPAAEFLAAVRDLLQAPERLLAEERSA